MLADEGTITLTKITDDGLLRVEVKILNPQRGVDGQPDHFVAYRSTFQYYADADALVATICEHVPKQPLDPKFRCKNEVTLAGIITEISVSGEVQDAN